jgi:hypothetical protein
MIIIPAGAGHLWTEIPSDHVTYMMVPMDPDKVVFMNLIVTAQGKRNSSRNSTRHGFSATDPSLDHDPPQLSSNFAPVSWPVSGLAMSLKPN